MHANRLETRTKKNAGFDEQALLLERMPLVDQVVGSFLRRIPRSVPRDDLRAAGAWGLCTAIRRNKGSGGPAFEYYARLRIRGAVIDELRARDYLPRRARWLAAGRREAGPGDRTAPRNVLHFDDVSAPELDRGLATTAIDPCAAAEAADTNAELHRAVEKLPDREKRIVSLHYFRGLRFCDIGRMLGVSEPRISQLHSRAVSRLRTELQPALEAA